MELNFDELQHEIQNYMTGEEIEIIHKAYYFAKSAHEGQIRKSGEPFIMHPVAVSIILSKLHLPASVITSGLLHDVIEDTQATYDDISEHFGEDVAYIVDGVTKLGAIQGLSNDFVRAENHRKIILSAAKDIRVLLVKLADRLHNMRTIGHMNSSKQKLIANETLEVYAPIAHRLGMYHIKWELEDLSFKCINPDAYEKIAKKLNMKRTDREEFVEHLIDQTEEYLKDNEVNMHIKGRSKHIYSIYQKISKEQKDFDEITDLFAFRVIVDTIPDCYRVLGLLHEKYKPIPMRFKDYIPTPKHNMYQSIHTTVLTEKGFPVEFQIRTKEMDVTAEHGIASHWMYKEGQTSDEIQFEIKEQLPWLQQAIENDTNDAQQFMNTVKLDYLSKNVIVYTPKGDVIEIPEGSTTLDFAYYIHTTVGNTAVSAIVNDRVVSLFYKLHIGDIVQIITNDNAQPSVSYIQKVKTTKAKDSLRKYFKDVEKRQIETEGRKLLLKFAIDNDVFKIKDILENNNVELLKNFGADSIEQFYYLIGNGDILLNTIIKFLKNENLDKSFDVDVLINDDENITDYKLCRYCSPLPGDEINARLTEVFTGTKMYFVHRSDCVNAGEVPAKFTNLAQQNIYVSRLQIELIDKPKSVSKVLEQVALLDLNITSIFLRASIGAVAFGRISLEVKNKKQIDDVINELKKLDVVINVIRLLDEEL